MHDYVTAVCADVAASARQQPPLQTVFFGGGTPSLLPPTELGRILAALREAFGIAPGAEVSMEMDPGARVRPAHTRPGAAAAAALTVRRRRAVSAVAGTFDDASLAAYLSLGVTRVNLGVQSFDAAMLTGARAQRRCCGCSMRG